MIPSGMAISIASTIAAIASSKVAGMRSGNRRGDRLIGAQRGAEVAPRQRPSETREYCTSSGRSSPSLPRSCAMSSGDALSPSIA